MRNDHSSPATGIEDQHTHDHGLARQGGALGGPSMVAGNGEYLYGLGFQLDSGHRNGDGSEEALGGVRVYELDYVPPERAAMRLAKIYVTGDRACHVMDRARGAWLCFEPGTEYWYLNDEALATLMATSRGGKIVFRIAHASCRSGMSFDEVAWGDVAAVVEQVTARDVVWQPSGEQGTWSSEAYSFTLSSGTPASVSGREGCLLALRLTVTTETGADGRPIRRLASTEWYQGEGQGALFTGWSAGEGVVLEQALERPAGSMNVASCALELAPRS